MQLAAGTLAGEWNEQATEIDLSVQPRFYQTTLFLLLAAMAVIVTALAAHRRHVRGLNQRQRELEREVASKTVALREALAQVTELSEHDHLTGLSNRHHFDNALETEWRRAARSEKYVSLIMLDVDHFKQFNDQYGHVEGDRCLVRIAGVLQSVSKRAGDVAARYGGEELALVLPYMEEDNARQVGELIRMRVRELAIPNAASPAGGIVTVSVGVARMRPTGDNAPQDLVRLADQALYRAKTAGRDTVRFADTPG